MDSAASQFRRDRRNAQGSSPAVSAPSRPLSDESVDGATLNWDSEREVIVSASAIPTAAEAGAGVGSSVPPASAPAQTAPPSAPAPSASDIGLVPAGVAPLARGELADGSLRLGWEPGQPQLYAGPAAVSAKRGLVSGATVLPEIDEAPSAPRRLWRQPAFIVSMILTVVAVGVAVTLLVMAAVTGGPPRVSGLDITAGSGGVALHWSGPNVPYDVYVVDDGGEVTDISQIVRGRDVWIPRSFGFFDDASCFVVRADSVDGDVSLGADALDAQGAASVCVADARE